MNSGENYQGGYAFLSYFLTGESRAYRKETKTIDRTVPYEPFFLIDACRGAACGWGAWELAVGYSWVDLDDGNDIVVTDGREPAPRLQQRHHLRRQLVPQPMVADAIQLRSRNARLR
jgi:phosphate-selective porin